MRNYSLLIVIVLMLGLPETYAQKKSNARLPSKRATVVSATEPKFINPISLTAVTDLREGDPAYEAVSRLGEVYDVPVIYSNSLFKGNAYLKRGEFVIHFNDALESVRRFMDSLKLDTSLINTYDKHASYITTASQIKDIKPAGPYFTAVKGILENWGIAAVFTKSALLNANSTITEADVYDIFRVTMGYNNAAVAKKVQAIKRDAFAVVLADAIRQMRERAQRLPLPVPDKVSDTLYIQLPFDPAKK